MRVITVELVTLEAGECCRVVETGIGREQASVPEPSREEVLWGRQSLGTKRAALQLSSTPARTARADSSLVGLAMWRLFKLVGRAACLSADDHLCYGLCSQPELVCSGTREKHVFPALVCTEHLLSNLPLA